MLNQKSSSAKKMLVILAVVCFIALTVAVGVLISNNSSMTKVISNNEVSLAANDGKLDTPSGSDPEESYETMRKEFYKILNSFVVPTCMAVGVAVLTISLVVLGLNRAKEQDEAKIAALNKRMIHWGIGAILVFLAPVIVMGVAEIAMGIISNWGQ